MTDETASTRESIDPDDVEPRRSVIGVFPEGVDTGEVTAALEADGIDSDRIHVVSGDEGIELLDSGSGLLDALGKVLSDATEFRDRAIAALEAGRCVLVIDRVDDEAGSRLRGRVEALGLVEVHHFGKWTTE